MSFNVKARVRIEYNAAGAFALERHGEQMHGSLPIGDHLSNVVYNVRKHYDPLINIRGLEEIVSAAWLHDCVEDTMTTGDEICDEFGDRIGELVELVTDKAGRNRFERHLRTYHAIRRDPDAILIKLADRRHNHARSIQFGEHYATIYHEEYLYFKMALYNPGQFVSLWTELDNQYVELRKMLTW